MEDIDKYFDYEYSRSFLCLCPLRKGGVSGIYKITTNIDERFYIGSSRNISNRWKDHIKMLIDGRHHSPHFQRFINKHKVVCCRFEIVEECPKDQLCDREQFYLDTLQPFGEKGFNVKRKVIGLFGHKKPSVHKEVYQYSPNGLENSFSSASVAAQELDLNVNSLRGCLTGRIKTVKGFIFSYEPLNDEKLKSLYVDQRTKRLCRGSVLPKRVKRIDPYGPSQVFDTVKQAADTLGICGISIRKACRNKTPYLGYSWETLPTLRIRKNNPVKKRLGKFLSSEDEFPTESFKSVLSATKKDTSLCRNAIGKSIKNKSFYKGFYWRYYNV